MRAERLLRIILLLQARRRATAGALARELGVSTRTIQRDMTALSAAGIPVYATRGGDGGWALLADYRTSLTGLTASEALAVIVGRPPGILADLGLADPGESPVHKLLAALAPSARDLAEHARARIHVDTSNWGSDHEPNPVLPVLQRAVWDDRLVRIRYGTAPRAVTVAPLGLVCKGTVWYLVARRGGDFRTYRVPRIHDVTVTGESFTRPPDFDLVRHWHDADARFAETWPTYPVRLRLRGSARTRAGWVFARAKSISAPDADGWADAELDFGDEENALAGIRTLGTEVVVCEPERLRHKAVEIARQFVAANA